MAEEFRRQLLIGVPTRADHEGLLRLKAQTKRLCRDMLGWGKTLLTIDSPENAELIERGTVPVAPETVMQQGVVVVQLNAPTDSGGSSSARTMIPTQGEA